MYFDPDEKISQHILRKYKELRSKMIQERETKPPDPECKIEVG